eukprot:CAMPEP_0176494752 /NCGR_PEP_ID=MMETSP0200_2-20121128/10281_1 /TAXON_ID=947934 /ORGANISM="Chaetoceros sp., Strain GSL56" /LENGTH=597 /DNA_ID=CAMNT_0017892565 /DNA_START=47 /DNA_END=1837 /DNA_ORIENTATION=+
MSHQAHCKYVAHKYTTTLNFWPLQDLAFKDVDCLIEKQKERKTPQQIQCEPKRDRKQIKEQGSNKPDYDVLLCWSKEPRLFACESNKEGKRKYISTHLGRFINFYWRECDANERHFYELIRENTPCRLYFDIEYNKKANPTIDGKTNETLLNEFFDELQTEVFNVFKLSIDRASIVDMDSSTESKFSHHVIVHMPNKELFRNNIECGIFVKNFISRLAEEVATGIMKKDKGKDTLHDHFFVYNKDILDQNIRKIENMSQFKTCIVDTGVYTRNRIFRILGSTKYGKPATAALRISASNKFPFPAMNQNGIFLQDIKSTIDNIDIVPSVQDGDEDTIDEIMENALCTFAKVFSDTLVVPCMKDRKEAPILPSIILDQQACPTRRNIISFMSNTATTNTGCHVSNQQPETSTSHDKYITNIGPSPFPELDRFVKNVLATRKNINGSIRSWSIQNNNKDHLSHGIITYQIKDNRWCDIIQRSHKSNNIMWHVSIADCKYWQSCFDPDCRRHMSFGGKQQYDLPVDVKEHITEVLISQEVQVSDSFEKALLELNIAEDDHDDNKNNEKDISDSLYDECDESFERALLNLNLSENNSPPNKK